MKRLQLQPQIVCLLTLAATWLAGCEGKDSALQQELAELREAARIAKEEADTAHRKLANTEIKSAQTLKASLEAASKQLSSDLIAAFPGYRAESLTASRIVFVLDEKEAPYETTLQFHLKPTSPSALTPEMPAVIVDVTAGPDGNWRMPGQPQLRALQAAASAQASSVAARGSQQQSEAPPSKPPETASQDSPSRQSPPAKPRVEPPSRQPAPQDPSTRIISWGDESPAQPAPQARADAAAPSQQPTGSEEPSREVRPPVSGPGQPAASQTYEIRFDD